MGVERKLEFDALTCWDVKVDGILIIYSGEYLIK